MRGVETCYLQALRYPVPLAGALHGACPGMQVRVCERGGATPVSPGVTRGWCAVCGGDWGKHRQRVTLNTLPAPAHVGVRWGGLPGALPSSRPGRRDLWGEHPDRIVDFGSAAFQEPLKLEEFITLEFSKFAQLRVSAATSARVSSLLSSPCASRAKYLCD